MKRREPPSLDRIYELFNYNKDQGILFWDHTRRGIPKGPAGTINDKYGRLRVTVDGKRYYIHHIIWYYMTCSWPKYEIDHKDGNPANNVWSNLREATHIQNSRNVKVRIDNTSNEIGVRFDGKKWIARVHIGKELHLGRFNTKAEAVAARKGAVKMYYEGFDRDASTDRIAPWGETVRMEA